MTVPKQNLRQQLEDALHEYINGQMDLGQGTFEDRARESVEENLDQLIDAAYDFENTMLELEQDGLIDDAQGRVDSFLVENGLSEVGGEFVISDQKIQDLIEKQKEEMRSFSIDLSHIAAGVVDGIEDDATVRTSNWEERLFDALTAHVEDNTSLRDELMNHNVIGSGNEPDDRDIEFS